MAPVRAVLDANVVISALIRPDSAPGRILRAAIEGEAVIIVVSAPLLDELRAALAYPRIRRLLRMNRRDIEEFALLLERIADPVSIAAQPSTGLCRDPDDEPYLQTAIVGRADVIVSGDRDLLDLGAAEDIPIVAPAEFLRAIRERGARKKCNGTVLTANGFSSVVPHWRDGQG